MVGLNRHVGSNPTLSAIDLAVCQKKVTDYGVVSDGLQEKRLWGPWRLWLLWRLIEGRFGRQRPLTGAAGRPGYTARGVSKGARNVPRITAPTPGR
jgi:hypothetical protein